MNLKDFHIVSDAEDSFHIKHKGSGKAFTVDKSKLSPKAMAMVQKLCSGGYAKMAEGGSVFDSAPDQVELNDSQKSSFIPNTDISSMIANTAPQVTPVARAQPRAEQPAAAPQSAQPAQVDPLMKAKQDENDILSKQEKGIQGYQNSLEQSNQNQQKAYQDLIDAQSKMKTPDQIESEYKAKDDALMQHYMDSKIDPNRYTNNMSTGSKILAGIALAIGGGGAALAGQNNLAFDTIHKAIQNDIEAQQNDQSKSMNLYKLNRENMHDDMQAHLATQNQMLTGVQAKVAMAGAQTQNADAKLRASELVSQIEQQKAMNRQRLALFGQGGVSQVNPLQLAGDPTIVPKDHQKQVITELGQAESASKNEDNIKKLFYQAAKDTRPISGMSTTSVMNSVPFYQPPSIKALNLLYDPLIHDNEGRINELEQQHVQANSPQWGDSDETVDKKWNAIHEFLNHKKSAPTATAFGLNPERFANTSSNPVARMSAQQQQYYNWAMANPKNPKAQIVLEKLGVR